MSDANSKYFQWSIVNGLVVIEVTHRELSHKSAAEEWGDELRAVHARKPSDHYLIDFHNTDYLSSTAFATLILFSKTLAKTAGRLAICGLKPDVRKYADILRVGTLVPIHEDLDDALDAFS